MTQVIRLALLAGFLLFAASRFLWSGLFPATRSLAGDFAAVFPTSYFAQLRPDFPTEAVWSGWFYGPMLHFLTLPLLLVPRWSMVPVVWALVNCAALAVSFMLVRRLPSMRPASSTSTAVLAALWLLYQPLVNCLSQGNIEIVEMAMILGGLVALSRGWGRLSGVVIGVAAMTKFLPFGFLAWFLLKRRWRAFGYGIATVAVIVAIASVTLGWKDAISLENIEWSMGSPLAGHQELSVTSLFMHRTGVLLLDASDPTSNPVAAWFPPERAATAFRVGLGVSFLIGVGLAAALFVRRRAPTSPFEVALLFMTMFMILPWNHDYYYIFAIVPISILFLDSVARRDRVLLCATVIGYLLISPPVPFSWIDRMGWLRGDFGYVYNYLSLPILGALTVWVASAQRLFTAGRDDHDILAVRRSQGARRMVLGFAGLVLAVAAVAYVARLAPPTRMPSPNVALDLEPALDLSGPPALALSPSGAHVAYVALRDQVRSLCIRAVASRVTTCIPETADATAPFFSPDSRWVAFFAGTHLRKVPVNSPAVQRIAELEGGGHIGHWAQDGTILVATPTEGILRVSTTPGRAYGRTEVLVPPLLGDGPYSWPTMLPSNDAILFSVAQPSGGLGAERIFAFSTRTGRRRSVVRGSQPHFNQETGHLTYTSAGRILTVRFDPEKLNIIGPAFPVVANVLVTPGAGPFVAYGGSSAIAFISGTVHPVVRREFVWVDRKGAVTPLSVMPDTFQTPRASPDGRKVAVAIRGVVTDVWTYDVATWARSRVTFTAVTNDSPVWTPGGEIAFSVPLGVTARSGPRAAVFLTPPGGTELGASRLWEGRGPVSLGSWSSGDGRIIGTVDGDLWMFDPVSGGPPSRSGGAGGAQTLVVQTAPLEMTPVFSPDGRYFAYASNESGRFEVYVRARLGSADRIRISTDGGTEPVWSATGRELFYRHDDAVLAVPVDTRAAFSAGTTRLLFRGAYFAQDGQTNYDVGPDGRFLMLRTHPLVPVAPAPLIIGRYPVFPTSR